MIMYVVRSLALGLGLVLVAGPAVTAVAQENDSKVKRKIIERSLERINSKKQVDNRPAPRIRIGNIQPQTQPATGPLVKPSQPSSFEEARRRISERVAREVNSRGGVQRPREFRWRPTGFKKEWKASPGPRKRVHVRSGHRDHYRDRYRDRHKFRDRFRKRVIHHHHHHYHGLFGHHRAFGGFGFQHGHWRFVIVIGLPTVTHHRHHRYGHGWWDGRRTSLRTWNYVSTRPGPSYRGYDLTGVSCVTLHLRTRDGEEHQIDVDPRYYEARDPGDLYAALWGELEQTGRLELQDVEGVLYVFPAGVLQEIEAAPCY